MTDTTTDQGADAPRLNKRQQAKIRTEAKVLDAGRALFNEVGYERATIRAIAKRAGMSTGAVFANYEDKRELYTCAFGHPPITPEMGRRALLALQVLTIPLGGENGADAADELDAVDVIRRRAEILLEEAGLPPIAIRTDDDRTCRGIYETALEEA